MEIVIIIVLIILLLAIVGFASVVSWLVKLGSGPQAGKSHSDPLSFPSEKPALKDDVLATRRLIEHLYQQDKIDSDRYCEWHHFLKDNFPSEMLFNRYLLNLKGQAENSSTTEVGDGSGKGEVALSETDTRGVAVEAEPITVETSPHDSVAEPAHSSSHSKQHSIKEPAHDLLEASHQVSMGAQAMAQAASAPAPWDLPDPPITPRVSRRELMAQFMREKNMRWGELTSGILIVMSAIGLVVSLRNDFLGRIPYFSSLMFMLITAGLIGSGIYTLKKWKLRKTSRGVLVIGLMLIPLNFAAACVLSGGEQQRSLDDPILWLATAIGAGVFGFLAWISSAGLFRRHSSALVSMVIGSGLLTLLFYRLPQMTFFVASSLMTTLLLMFPLGLMLLWSTGGFSQRFWFKGYWSQRRLTTTYLQFGIGIFAILVAASMLIVGSESKSKSIVLLTPIFILCSMLVAWLGGLMLNRRQSIAGKNPVIGKSMEILGWMLAALWMAGSILNPTLFVFNAFFIAVGLVVYLSIVAGGQPGFSVGRMLVLSCIWGLLSAAFLLSLNIYLGHLEFEGWSAWSELGSVLLTGRSGLILLACGVAVSIAQAGLANIISQFGWGTISDFTLDSKTKSDRDHHSNSDPVQRIIRSGIVSGGSIFLAGCVLAVVASLVNRQNQVDANIASGLLMFGGLVTSWLVVIRDRRLRLSITTVPPQVMEPKLPVEPLDTSVKDQVAGSEVPQFSQPFESEVFLDTATGDLQRSKLLTTAVAACSVMLMFSAWLHLVVWNLAGSAWLSEQTGSLVANPWWGIAAASLFFSGLVCFIRSHEIEPMVVSSSVIGLLVVSVAAVYFMWDQTGNGTGLLVLSTIGLVMCGFGTTVRAETVQFCSRWLMGTLVVFVSGLGVIAWVLEWGFPVDWRTEPMPQHLMMQAIGGGSWVIFWTLMAMMFPAKSAVGWLGEGRIRVEHPILLAWVFLVSLFVSVGISDLARLELFAESVKTYDWFFQSQWIAIAVVVLSMAAALIYLQRSDLVFAGVMVILWVVGWGVGASYFESTRAVVSGLRWLWASAGLGLAILISQRSLLAPGWIMLRRGARMPGRSRLVANDMQRLIDISLLIFAGLVIGLGFIKLCQALLVGPTLLGGPTVDSWFHGRPLVSYAVPLVMLVSSFLWLAISERRVALAYAGSVVMQILAVIAIFFVIFSPFVEITTTLFVHSFHAISIGMTVYGLVWYIFRKRIDATLVDRVMAGEANIGEASFLRRSLESHLWLNAALLTSLSLLVMWRFYWQADQPGGWVSMIGSVGGQLAVFLFVGFALFLLRHEIRGWSLAKTGWGICWLGLIVIGFAAAAADWYPQTHRPLLAYRILCWGTIILGGGMLAWLGINHGRVRTVRSMTMLKLRAAGCEPSGSSGSSGSKVNHVLERLSGVLAAILMVWSLSFLFSLQDAMLSTYLFEGLSLQLLFAFAMIVLAFFTWYSTFYFLAAGMLLVTVGVLVFYKNLFYDQPWLLNLSGIAIVLVALSNLMVYFYFRYQKQILPPRRFVAFANTGIFIVTLWIALASMLEWPLAGFSNSVIWNRTGLVLLAGALLMLILSLWNDRRCLWVFDGYLMSVAWGVLFCAVIGINLWEKPFDQNSAMSTLAVISSIPLLWGWVWVTRGSWQHFLRRLRVPRVESLVRKVGTQSIAYLVIIGAFSIFAAYFCLVFIAEDRGYRYLVAIIPLILAGAAACFSNATDRRWLQVGCLALVTWGALYTAWAGLLLQQMHWPETLTMIVSGVVVLAVATFIYGFLIPRWVRAEDSWLTSFRQMTGITGGLAVGSLMLLLLNEVVRFDRLIGCGLGLAESMVIVGSTFAMIVGLISVAVRPIFDPYSLSLEGRKGYVYLAQFVTAGLALHLYLTMPWLFRFGVIKEYWPYLAMVICFSGIGLGTMLQRRQLGVLGDPLFATATVVPIAISLGVMVVDSQADTALVMLIVGVIYLIANHLRPSILSGMAVVLFCNLTIWFFYGKFDNFNLWSHPQWWLIPPAVSTLIAAQIYRNRMTDEKLAPIRYFCIAVIYVSSTSEIFINGLGVKLLPPMILAGLSVAGILLGILVQVRAFLYFGLAFLLMAMISMVAHAHQRFDHVWPWWAFGIILGISILVIFGLFEKRKKEIKKSGVSLEE